MATACRTRSRFIAARSRAVALADLHAAEAVGAGAEIGEHGAGESQFLIDIAADSAECPPTDREEDGRDGD